MVLLLIKLGLIIMTFDVLRKSIYYRKQLAFILSKWWCIGSLGSNFFSTISSLPYHKILSRDSITKYIIHSIIGVNFFVVGCCIYALQFNAAGCGLRAAGTESGPAPPPSRFGALSLSRSLCRLLLVGFCASLSLSLFSPPKGRSILTFLLPLYCSFLASEKLCFPWSRN